MTTRQHLQQHASEVNVDDAVEDEIKGKVDNLSDIGECPHCKKDFRLTGTGLDVFSKNIHDFTGEYQDKKSQDNNDQCQGDPVAGRRSSLGNSVLEPHLVWFVQSSDQGTVAESEGGHGNHDANCSFGPNEDLSRCGALVNHSNVNDILCPDL